MLFVRAAGLGRRGIGSAGLIVEVRWEEVFQSRIGDYDEEGDAVRREMLDWRDREISLEVCRSTRISRFARGLEVQLVIV